MRFFETKFLEEADEFIAQLAPMTIKKIFYNIDLAEQTNDPKLFKKLRNEIWEFRTNTLFIWQLKKLRPTHLPR